MKFTIPRRLPGLNEIIAANRANRYKGAGMKRDADTACEYCILAARTKGALYPAPIPCTVRFTWHMKDRRRDLDNVFSAKKFVLDALVHQGILKNDNLAHVVGLRDDYTVDGTEGVDVEIRGVDDGKADC